MTYSGSNYRGSASVRPGAGAAARVASAPGGGPTRRGLIGSAVGLVASIAAAGAGTAVWTTAKSANEDLDRAFDLEQLPDRPEKSNGAMNVLVLGSDARGDDSDDDARSDTAIILHVNESGTDAYGISIPRDMWVYIPPDPNAEISDTEAKFNAAYSWGGPNLTVQTIEALSEVRIDHIVEIDFPGLVEVVDALGGVEMYVEQTIESIHPPYRTFEEGWNTMNGEQALDWVRQRKQFPDGDFARMRHQQDLIKAIMDSALSAGVLTSQSTLRAFIESVSDAIKVDTEFNVVATAIDFMHLRSDDIVFLTTPHLGTGNIGGQSVVVYDEENGPDLWSAVIDDEVGRWVEQNPELAGQDESEE
ncbi:LCP family protein [Glycomyces xiaoerkulensis]|uniref:LCP family protein n=1 Tax=Glycomyces xiaoerkulensis TaxID=2038139 RepID=UPI000C26AF8E|nr:LCP family protein [Glycomyces xiaoerkulensis]